jgi:ZIP family zinc transporter
MISLVPALIAGLGFAFATFLVASAVGTSRAFHHASVVIAAGILLGICFADLIPEAFEYAEGTTGALAIAVGFLVLYVIEAMTHGHTHHHEPHASHVHAEEAANQASAHDHAHAHAHAHGPSALAVVDDKACVPTHAIAPFLLGLGLHNLADGLVIGASHEVSDAAEVGVAAGILIHQLPVGLSFAAVLLASGVAKRRMHLQAAMVAAMIPLGAIIVIAVPHLAGSTLGVLLGVAAGALIYVASGHLLPEAHSEERRPFIALLFAAAILGTVLFVAAME